LCQSGCEHEPQAADQVSHDREDRVAREVALVVPGGSREQGKDQLAEPHDRVVQALCGEYEPDDERGANASGGTVGGGCDPREEGSSRTSAAENAR
jgi:hypothetical protein